MTRVGYSNFKTHPLTIQQHTDPSTTTYIIIIINVLLCICMDEDQPIMQW